MSEHKAPPDKVTAFIGEVALLCKKYDASIQATDDYGMQINVDDQEYGGYSIEELCYKINAEGLS